MFTIEQTIAAAEEVVKELGADYVYPNHNRCTYATPGTFKPSCFVGRIVDKLDHEAFLEVAKEEKGAGSFPAACLVFDVIEIYNDPHLDIFESNVEPFLTELQRYQDCGHTFGNALDHAKGVV